MPIKMKELKDLSKDDLVAKIKSLKKEIFELNYQRKTGAVEKPARFKTTRRTIARIMTILKERDLTK